MEQIITNKVVHVQALIAVAAIDKEINPTEVSHIQNIMNLYGMSSDSLDIKTEIQKNIDKKVNIDNLLAQIIDRCDKKKLLQDLISLAFADGKFASEEMELITGIGLKLSLSKNEIEHLFDLNKKYLNSIKDINDFLNT